MINYAENLSTQKQITNFFETVIEGIYCVNNKRYL